MKDDEPLDPIHLRMKVVEIAGTELTSCVLVGADVEDEGCLSSASLDALKTLATFPGATARSRDWGACLKDEEGNTAGANVSSTEGGVSRERICRWCGGKARSVSGYGNGSCHCHESAKCDWQQFPRFCRHRHHPRRCDVLRQKIRRRHDAGDNRSAIHQVAIAR